MTGLFSLQYIIFSNLLGCRMAASLHTFLAQTARFFDTSAPHQRGWRPGGAYIGIAGNLEELAAVHNAAQLNSRGPQYTRPRPRSTRPRPTRLGVSVIVRTEGVGGLFRGFGAFAPRVMAASAVQLSTYDRTKALLVRRYGLRDGLPVHFCASWLTGIAVVLAMQPFDFAATRLMNQGRRGIAAGEELYSSPLDCLCKTVRAEGVLGPYKGALANYLRFGPYCILVFVFLEQLRRLETSLVGRVHGNANGDGDRHGSR
mgnify:CR=1 FL=1